MKNHHYGDCNYRGSIQRLTYQAPKEDGSMVEKYMNVYLPYGYDKEGGRKYNVLYVMHGGGGNPDAFLDCAPTKNMLDVSFAKKEADPCIVVFASYYMKSFGENEVTGLNVEWENRQILNFQKELREIVVPLVESTFRTYAASTDPEGLKTSRRHRAFTGFSMGGGTTWYAFLYNLEIISEFIPLSGDCWILAPRGGETCTEETAKYLSDFIKNGEFGPDDFHIYAATGTEDIAHPALTPMIGAMRKYTDEYRFSENFGEGNLNYLLKEGAVHSYEEVYQYLYNYLPYLFKAEK